jgi:hypothetical protein
MYAKSDFLLALVAGDDWLAEAAEDVYRRNRDDLWTSQFALLELLVVAYRENLDAESVVVNAKNLLEVRGDAELVLAAASYVEAAEMPPFDAIHLVSSGDDRVVSTDATYDLPERVPLEPDS